MEEFQLEHISGEWQIFFYLSKVGLKTVLLHNGNKLLTFTLVGAVHMTETYEYLQVSCKT